MNKQLLIIKIPLEATQAELLGYITQGFSIQPVKRVGSGNLANGKFIAVKELFNNSNTARPAHQ